MWEYITIVIEPCPIAALNDIFNDIGLEGWQLCLGTPHPIAPDNMVMIYSFKRPILEKSGYLARRASQLQMQQALQARADEKRAQRVARKAPDPNNFDNG